MVIGQKSLRAGSWGLDLRLTKGQHTLSHGNVPIFERDCTRLMTICKTSLFSPLLKLVSENRPVSACEEKHAKHVELRYESECCGK